MRKIRSVLATTGVLAGLVAGAVVGAPAAEASGITLHNNYGSDRVVTARDSAGRLHYLYLGQTDNMGSSMRIYVATGTCMRYGDPVTGVAFGKTCAPNGPVSWVASRPLWVDVIG